MFCLYIFHEEIKSLDLVYILAHKVCIGVTLSVSQLLVGRSKGEMNAQLGQKAGAKKQNAPFLDEYADLKGNSAVRPGCPNQDMFLLIMCLTNIVIINMTRKSSLYSKRLTF